MVALTRFALFLSLTFSCTQAHPAHGSVAQTPNPGHLFKRALPTWKNFTPNDATNPQIVQLTQAFKDMATVVNAVLAADQNTFNTIFLKYFRDGMQTAVKQVLSNMVTPATKDPSTGADILSTIVVDSNDHANLGATMACYTSSGETDSDPWSIHFEQSTTRNAYQYPALSAIACGAGGTDTGTIGTVVSDKMASLGGYALVHELTHVGPVFQSTAIKAFTSLEGTGDIAYGPQDVLQLLAGQGRNSQGNPLPAQWCITNADSYAWFVNEVYWTITCKRNFGPPTDNSYAPAGVCPAPSTDANCGL